MKVEKTQHDGFKPITLSIVIENKEEYDIIECILNRNCSIPKLVEKEWGYGNGLYHPIYMRKQFLY